MCTTLEYPQPVETPIVRGIRKNLNVCFMRNLCYSVCIHTSAVPYFQNISHYYYLHKQPIQDVFCFCLLPSALPEAQCSECPIPDLSGSSHFSSVPPNTHPCFIRRIDPTICIPAPILGKYLVKDPFAIRCQIIFSTLFCLFF